NDSINACEGYNTIIGDNGAMYFTGWSPQPGDNCNWLSFQNSMLYYVTSSDPSSGGNDTITTGDAGNIIIGGSGNNAITAGDGGNTVIGANGNVSLLAPGLDGTVQTSDPAYGGNNNITTGIGNDRILGGTGSNMITDAGGSNVIFGADGVLNFVQDTIEGDSTLLAFSGQSCLAPDEEWTIYTDGLLVSAVSTDTNAGGTDTIIAGDGQNLIVGGYGSSTITAGNGQNIIIGGNGMVNFAGAGMLSLVESTVPVPSTASNTITAGDGNNIIIGGVGSDTITAGNGMDVVFGDAGEVTFSHFNRYSVESQFADSQSVGDQSFDAVDDTVYATALTIYPTVGGTDTITLGSGNVVVFGGTGNDIITTAGVMGSSTNGDHDSDDPPSVTINAGGSQYVIFGGDGQVVFSSGGWVTSATLTFPQFSGTDTITIGSSPSVVLQGVADGEISIGPAPTPQFAAAPAPAGQNTSPGLTASELQPIVVEAEAIWARALGADASRLAILNGITVQVGDLPGELIGGTIGDTIYIDRTADGWGWFIDPTAAGNAEFQATSIPGVLTATQGSAASGHMDLLSTVLHEMGNAMGFPEDTGQDVTGNVLTPGTRRLPLAEGDTGAAPKVPVIDWSITNSAAVDPPVQLNAGDPSWIDSFVNNLGQNGKHHGVNSSLRIKLG
ncbi:MAG TPA: calcium-binding protein, partial [Rhodopila sp.]|nr:calcium-binding protein [Rhodopila sp.]